MDKNNSRGYIIVINSKGGRKQVKVEDYNKSNNLNEDNINMSDYKYDLAWDLSHGFTEANKAFSDIEKNP